MTPDSNNLARTANAVPADSDHTPNGGAKTPYREGHDDARKEILDAIVWIAEEFLRGRERATPRTRQELYAFIAHLDHRLHDPPSPDTVEGGLGI